MRITEIFWKYRFLTWRSNCLAYSDNKLQFSDALSRDFSSLSFRTPIDFLLFTRHVVTEWNTNMAAASFPYFVQRHMQTPNRESPLENLE